MSASPGADPAEDSTAPLDPEEGGEEQAAPEPTPQELKAQLREEKRAREAADALAAERLATVEFWKKREERAAAAIPPPAPATPEPDPLADLDLLKLLTEAQNPDEVKQVFTKTVKQQMARELRNGNYVSKADMEAYIGQIVNGANDMSKLVADFPDLGNPQSEFFAETQKQIAAMQSDPSNQSVPTAKLYRMAALETKAAMVDAGKYGKEPAEDRYERIANQRGGSRGHQKADSGTSLSSDQKLMAAKFGLTEKQYLEGLKQTRLGPGLTADQIAKEFSNGR